MSVSNSGSGSVSATYTDNSSNSYTNTNITVVPFSTGDSAPLSSNYSVPGLGASESLTPTTCPVSVYNPTGAKVLGCYSVARPAPAPQVNYTRVVRPVIYVRYPVATPVPYNVDVPYPVYVGNGLNRGFNGGFQNGGFNHGHGVHHGGFQNGGFQNGGGFGFNNSGFGGAGALLGGAGAVLGGGFNGGFGGGCGGGNTRYGSAFPGRC